MRAGGDANFVPRALARGCLLLPQTAALLRGWCLLIDGSPKAAAELEQLESDALQRELVSLDLSYRFRILVGV